MFRVKKEEYINKTFRLQKELVEELSACASQYEISLNSLVSQCCRYALDHMKIDDDTNQEESHPDFEVHTLEVGDKK